MGLHWLTEDWTDGGLGSPTWHNGADASSSCMVMTNSELQGAVVLLSNIYADESIHWIPATIAFAAPWEWVCGDAWRHGLAS